MPALAHTINPENIPWLVEHCGDDWPFDTIVADESTRLKGFRLRKGGKRTVALATVTWTKVKRFYELTGTPAANGLIDLWGQLWFLDKGSRLGRTCESAARIRPLSVRMGLPRAGFHADLREADRHHVPHAAHTAPKALPRPLVQQLAALSQGVVVMTRIAARLLADVFGVSGSSIQVIPHGVPAVPFDRDEGHKARLGLTGHQVICTFGLINRGKGLEHMIRAMPQVVAACPEALYLIVGVTHPQVKRQEGEICREGLVDLAASLGVGHMRFVNEAREPGADDQHPLRRE